MTRIGAAPPGGLDWRRGGQRSIDSRSMTTNPPGTTGPAVATPPAAQRSPTERTHHGDAVIDEYAWLADKENPQTIAFLTAENAYTEAMTADQEPLRGVIFDEIKARTRETDLSVPTRKGGWWYYSRTVEGKQYAVHCRRGGRAPGTGGPVTRGGGAPGGDEEGGALPAGRPARGHGAADDRGRRSAGRRRDPAR